MPIDFSPLTDAELLAEGPRHGSFVRLEAGYLTVTNPSQSFLVKLERRSVALMRLLGNGVFYSDGLVLVLGRVLADSEWPAPEEPERFEYVQPVMTTRPLMTSYSPQLLMAWNLEDFGRKAVVKGWSAAEIEKAEAALRAQWQNGDAVVKVSDKRVVIQRRGQEVEVRR